MSRRDFSKSLASVQDDIMNTFLQTIEIAHNEHFSHFVTMFSTPFNNYAIIYKDFPLVLSKLRIRLLWKHETSSCVFEPINGITYSYR